MSDPNARLLGGRYEVRSLIGRGGMAQVHLGRDTKLSRLVAIKMLRVDLARDAVFQTRFRREAQAAASLNHPNIVAVYDTGEEAVRGADGHSVSVPYIVMEYVEGNTVKELLGDGTPVPIPEAVEITGGVLSALEYAHDSGLVHRDIKPGNVMLTNSGKVKVMDFGIARALADSQATVTQTNAVVGTAQYLSPEQARGEQVDERSDIYSAGCMLFELLTGQPPFQGDSAVSLAYQHVSEAPPVPSSIAGDVPAALDQVTLKALAKNPDDRYDSAAAMDVDLVRAADGMTIQAPPVGTWATAATGATAATRALQPGQTATQTTTQYTGPTRSLAASQSGTTGAIPVQTADAKKSKKTGVWVTLLVLLATALIGAVVWVFLGNREEQIEMVQVPTGLVGLSQAEARRVIDDAGLIFVLGDPVESDSIEEGDVAEVLPEEGTEVEIGSTVEVMLSSGPATEEVPDMNGWTRDQVDAELKRLGFVTGTVTEENDPDQKGGTLIRTKPAAGSIQPRGESIDLVFSSGNVEVPGSLAGQPQQEVLSRLRELSLNPEVDMQESGDVRQGIVIRVEPVGVLPQGSVITVVVSSGPPPPPEPEPEPTPEPPQSG